MRLQAKQLTSEVMCTVKIVWLRLEWSFMLCAPTDLLRIPGIEITFFSRANEKPHGKYKVTFFQNRQKVVELLAVDREKVLDEKPSALF
jgi:hypothetical protein